MPRDQEHGHVSGRMRARPSRVGRLLAGSAAGQRRRRALMPPLYQSCELSGGALYVLLAARVALRCPGHEGLMASYSLISHAVLIRSP